MPDCNKTLHELQLFLDGELPNEDYEHVLGHLDECLECYHTFDFQAELKQVIAEKCREQMPPDLLERIQQCLTPEDAAAPDTAEPG
jgi:mycothiol system anti-sigma-R factor